VLESPITSISIGKLAPTNCSQVVVAAGGKGEGDQHCCTAPAPLTAKKAKPYGEVLLVFKATVACGQVVAPAARQPRVMVPTLFLRGMLYVLPPTTRVLPQVTAPALHSAISKVVVAPAATAQAMVCQEWLALLDSKFLDQ
jgi:hypothetical protein